MTTEILEENKIINICTRIPAAISVLCSAYIVYEVLSNHQKRSSPTQRIVVAMSISDIVFSFFMFLATWPMPRGTKDAYGAVGNQQTCTMQGFFIQLSVMTPMYNGLLALYCYLYVCKDWGKQRMMYVELYGHIFVFVVAFLTAIVCLSLGLYNSMRNFCWLGPYPKDCTQSFQSIDGTTDCIRGDNAHIYRYALYGAILWLNICWTFFSMTKVYLHIRKQEKKMEAYASAYLENSTRSSTTKRANSDSRDVAFRGVLFTGAFLVTFLPLTINEIIEFTGKENFPVHVLSMTLVSSQGIFNFLVYIIHPAVSSHLKEKRTTRREDSLIARATEQTKCDHDASKQDEFSDEEKEQTDESLPPDAHSQEDGEEDN